MWVLSEGSYALWSIYSVEGLEKWSKALIADLRFLSLIPGLHGTFDRCLQACEAQKDIYYATMSIGAFADYIDVDEDGTIDFTLPTYGDGAIDWAKIFKGMANFCDAGQFLNKYEIYDLAGYSEHVGELKDFFTALASLFDIYKCVGKTKKLLEISNEERDKYWTMEKWETIFKFASSIGKILLVCGYRIYGKQPWLVIAELITNNIALARFILEDYHERLDRFEHPY